MTRLILVWIFIFNHLIAYPQLTVNDLKNSETYIIHPNALKWDNKSLPFKNVVVIDNRFDTSKLGYKKVFSKYQKMKTTKGLAETIQQKIHTAIQNSMDTLSSGSLYIFINHLWIQQTTNRELSKRRISQPNTNYDTNFVSCNATIESYILDKELFYPLLKIDSTISVMGVLWSQVDKSISIPFQLLLDELAAMDLNRKRKPVPSSVLSDHYKARLKYPILNSDSYLKGVYLNYRDFLNNKVTYPFFEVEYGRVTDELYVVDNGNKRLQDKLWGFNDGENIFIKIGFNFFELSRENFTYELIGAKVLKQNASLMKTNSGGDLFSLGIDNIRSERKIRISTYRPLQLNMDTGEPY